MKLNFQKNGTNEQITRYSKLVFVIAIVIFTTFSCTDWNDHLEIVSEPLLEEVSPDDPANTGLAASCPGIPESPELFDSIVIDPDLPDSLDLSYLMPPVRSQGQQGSCAAWATTYYMKSYQEKVQYGYDYTDYTRVMSPAYTYNQAKIPGDCSLGSCVETILYILKTQGTATWHQFPYHPSGCFLLPSADQMTNAAANKISKSYVISSQTEINGVTIPTSVIIKNLISQGNPVIIGMALDQGFTNATPRNDENLYIYKNYNPTQFYGNHAMLIVGYDDTLEAFKVVNSWGTAWGNEGYCWISYDFFRLPSDPDWIGGALGVWVAYDE